jgi:hypothetical protein
LLDDRFSTPRSAASIRVETMVVAFPSHRVEP